MITVKIPGSVAVTDFFFFFLLVLFIAIAWNSAWVVVGPRSILG